MAQVLSLSQAVSPSILLEVDKFHCVSKRLIIPTLLLRKCFEHLDVIHSADVEHPSRSDTTKQFRGIGNSMEFCQRLRDCCLKTIFYNGPIIQKDGKPCHTTRQFDEAMLATREFWFLPPVEHDSQWEDILTQHENFSAGWHQIPLPTQDQFVQHALHSKDSSPGPDGIPYAAWRIHPDSTGHALGDLLHRITSGCIEPPVSVGVWIPKAFERILDCTIAALAAEKLAPELAPCCLGRRSSPEEYSLGAHSHGLQGEQKKG